MRAVEIFYEFERRKAEGKKKTKKLTEGMKERRVGRQQHGPAVQRLTRKCSGHASIMGIIWRKAKFYTKNIVRKRNGS